MRLLFVFLILTFSSFCCDLNHDWRTKELTGYRDIDPSVLRASLLDLLLEDGKTMLLSVKDLYAKKGQIREDSNTISNRTTSERTELEEKLMGMHSDEKLLVLDARAEGLEQEDLFKPEVIRELSKKYNVARFLGVKLRRYQILNRQFEDAYVHNKGVLRDSRLHQMEYSLAWISPEAKYMDFTDHSIKKEEEEIYLLEEGQRTEISVSKIREDGSVSSSLHFLGLESIESLGKFVSNLVVKP